MSQNDYRAGKDFVKSLAKSFGISPSGPRGSFIVFSSKAHSVFSFEVSLGNDFEYMLVLKKLLFLCSFGEI